MKIVRDTPFEFGYLVAQVRPPQPSLTIVVKATFTLAHGLACPLAPVQVPCGGDVHHDDEPSQSLRYDSDYAVLKPRGECTVVGTCHPPAGSPPGVSGVAFKIGSVTKALAVFGDRQWVRRALVQVASEPAPFAAMPLRWERSFGGAGFDRNPVGVGAGSATTPTGARHPLPNVEDPRQMMRSAGARPDPAGCFPIPRTWPARTRRAGTCDAEWLRTRWPDLPRDFDWGYFNAAPEDQQIQGYWRGDEEIVLRNLRPGLPLVQTRLPGRRARCFVASGGRLREVAMQLDTLAVDADAGVVFAVWRGVTEVASEKLTDIERLFVMDEPLAARTTVAGCGARMEALLAAEAADDNGFAPVAVPGIDPGIDPGAGPSTAAPAVTPPAVPRAEIAERLQRGEGFAGEDLSGADLSGMDLAGRDLAGAILAGAVLEGASLAGASMAGAMLAGAVLRGAVLRGAVLTNADMTGVSAAGAVLDGAVLDGAVLVGAALAGAKLKGASLRGAELTQADLTGADLREARLDKADLTGATLDGADFTRASLVDATLEGVSAARVTMDECDLTKLRASDGARFPDGSFRNARAKGSRWGGAVLDRAVFLFADLERADFSAASLVGASLGGCTLRGARFQEARMSGASLLKADAMEANFEAADLSQADLRGANLFGAQLWRAHTAGARFEQANLTRTRLA